MRCCVLGYLGVPKHLVTFLELLLGLFNGFALFGTDYFVYQTTPYDIMAVGVESTRE